MPQKIERYFGIGVNVKNVTQNPSLQKFRDESIEKIKKIPGLDLDEVNVFIYSLDLKISPSHFNVKDISKRIDKLVFTIRPKSKKIQENGKIWFLNNEVKMDMNPAIKVHENKSKINYELSGDYCSNNNSYIDYIAVVIKKYTKLSDRVLEVMVSARATSAFGKKLKNVNNGTAITRKSFKLTKN